MSLEALTELSRFYGKNPDYVLAGGGNTSWKEGETLYVKSSGMSLADAVPDSFVKMDRKALARIWEKTYPPSDAADPLGGRRESEVLADMMAARLGGGQKRPSVEALLHDIMPFAFVVHLHPALVNGLTCSRQGEAAMSKIFGEDAVWIPLIEPGYVLSRTVKTAMDTYGAKHGKQAAVIFLQNHGVFVGADDTKGIKELYDEIMSKIGAMTVRKPDFSDEKLEPDAVTASSAGELAVGELAVGKLAETLAELAGSVSFMTGSEIAVLIKDRASFAPVSSAFTPDHIVYAGSEPLFVEADADIRDAWKNHAGRTERNPKIVAVQGLGIFGAAASERAALLALNLFKDAVKVAAYAESFGGPRFMTQDKIDFINNWEVERFRTGVSTK